MTAVCLKQPWGVEHTEIGVEEWRCGCLVLSCRANRHHRLRIQRCGKEECGASGYDAPGLRREAPGSATDASEEVWLCSYCNRDHTTTLRNGRRTAYCPALGMVLWGPRT